jgi:hypothetical protein
MPWALKFSPHKKVRARRIDIVPHGVRIIGAYSSRQFERFVDLVY